MLGESIADLQPIINFYNMIGFSYRIFIVTSYDIVQWWNFCWKFSYLTDFMFNWTCRWERYQVEEEASLGRGKRQRKAVSYRETFASIPAEALSEVMI
jgi:hypothetical protein